jgi:hypothetical protein
VRTTCYREVIISLFIVIATPFASQAQAYQLYESGAFLNSSTLGGTSLAYLDSGSNDFSGTGIDLSYSNGLDSSGYGSLTWEFTNNTASTLSDVSLFGYVDAEIVETFNSFANEYGEYIGITGSGSGDINPDSWEIDEPGYVFGDIYYNLLSGSLDNSNAVPAGLEDDVSLALGFELGDILVGQTWTMMLVISESDIGGLYHGDAEGLAGAYVNGTVIVDAATPVPEPSAVLMFLLGMFGMTLLRRQRA